jgi:hypothetical protein
MMPCGPRGEKRPADAIGNAVKIMRIATGEETEELKTDPAAAELEAGAVRRGRPSMEDVVKLIEYREDLRSGALFVG